MLSTLLCYFDESITSHILDTCKTNGNQEMKQRLDCQRTFVSLVHELEEFIDDCLQELPVRFKEAWILTDNVHNV